MQPTEQQKTGFTLPAKKELTPLEQDQKATRELLTRTEKRLGLPKWLHCTKEQRRQISEAMEAERQSTK